VANQTLASERLVGKVRDCVAAGPCTFHVLVPATHTRDQVVWTEGGSEVLARRRLRRHSNAFASSAWLPDPSPAPVDRSP
jgi:hypothetical protein